MHTVRAPRDSIKQAPTGSPAVGVRATAKPRAPDVPVVPDWCNLGVTLRVAIAVQVVALGIASLGASSPSEWMLAFLQSAFPVEPVLVGSLMFGCLVRRFTLAWPAWVQIGLACAIPGGLVYLFEWLLKPLSPGSATGTLVWRDCILAVALTAIMLYWFWLRAQSQLPALAEARLQALQARIRPHFLFNSLNAVLSLIRTEPRRAETALEDLADLFRVLMRDRRDLVPLREEIALCEQYLAIEKLRLGDRLAVEISIAPETRETLVPLLLLQPLIENAVHHGIEPAAAGGVIEVLTSREGSVVDILITNPWNGATRAGNQVGLDNVRQRLSLLHDLEARLETSVRAGRYEVRVRLPHTEAEAVERQGARV